jgi:hypothetical protein
MTPQALVPALLIPLIGWRLYRRFKSNIGRQELRPTRMTVRIVILTLIGALFVWGVTLHPTSAALSATLGGLALGAAIGMVGLRLTKFDFSPTGNYYTPNTYLGASLSALLVARIIYRFFIVGTAAQMSYQQGGGDPFAAYSSSPLTLLILMLTVGYYIAYNAGLLLKARSHSQ